MLKPTIKGCLEEYRFYKVYAPERAWEYAQMWYVMRVARNILLAVLMVFAVIVIAVRQAEAITLNAQERVAASVAEKDAFIAGLVKIAERCLTMSGGAVWIGDELFFCGLAATGIKRETGGA